MRSLLNKPHRTAAEGVWRLRGLRLAAPGQPGRLIWNERPLAYADGSAAFQQLHEIFVAHVYDFVCATPQPRILDCGAHTGLAVLRWRQLHPGARITAIEADPAIAALLRENVRAWNDSETEVINAAAWTHDGEVRFAATGQDNGLVSADGTRVIPALDLARLCREPVDLLKLDIEGAEAVVVAHLAATGALKNVRALVCEWHEWGAAAPRLHEALAQLAAAGLTYRIAHADTLGDRATAVFPQLRHPGNQLMIYAWQA
ncbi:MAG: FkbM family methyltransferase [Opitutaceae bacterium]|nr:FkbM family methyltransferase [Opitutaceae bacterium]